LSSPREVGDVTRTPTLPPDDKKLWRKLVALTHPDSGGDHELCIWTQNVREHVCRGVTAPWPQPKPEPEPRTVYEDGRMPFPAGAIFEELTAAAIERADAVGDLYGHLLFLLEDCYSVIHLDHEEQRGASYKRLAYVAHLIGLSKSERIEWYQVAESIPLSDRHAGHIIKRLKEAV
jgi:hypothetical protein